MKTRVSVIDVKYRVNENKGAVTCRMLVDTNLSSYFDEFEAYRLFVGPLWMKKLGTSDERFWVTATARVKDDDTFSAKKGKKIAHAKASYKACRRAGMMCKEIERVLFFALCKAHAMRANCIKQCNRELEYVRL